MVEGRNLRRRRAANTALLEWTAIASFVFALALVVYEIVGYSAVREQFPLGMEIAGVPVGGMTQEQAVAEVRRFYSQPVELYYGEDLILLDPAQINYQLQSDIMLARAETYRTDVSWWGGFWNYLWRQAGRASEVQLVAEYSRSDLAKFLEDVAARYDRPPVEPIGVTDSLEYVEGQPGVTLDIDSSIAVIDAALQVPQNRRAQLTVRENDAPPPTLDNLRELLIALMDRREFAGIYSFVVIDLATGQEISYNPDVAYAGMSIMKIPILIETYKTLDGPPIADTEKILNETIIDSGNFSANLLLDIIGEGDQQAGVDRLTANTASELGLVNTFMAVPYDQEGPYPEILTPANQRTDLYTEPDPAMQTTPSDMATLLSMLYQCAYNDNGALRLLYPTQLTSGECESILELLKLNDTDFLIEGGVPANVAVAHKHGFATTDTHGDAGIVFSPGGDYVLVVFLYEAPFLEWNLSNPLFGDISAAVYRYFNPE